MTYLDLSYRTDGSGRTAVTRDRNRRVRNLLEAVLLTAPGERVNRPEFGAGLLDLLFDANSEALETASEFLIRSSITRHLSDVLAIDALAVERDEGELRITLTYTVIGDDEQQTETFTRKA